MKAIHPTGPSLSACGPDCAEASACRHAQAGGRLPVPSEKSIFKSSFRIRNPEVVKAFVITFAFSLATSVPSFAQDVPHRIRPSLPANLAAGRGETTVALPNLPVGLYSFYIHGSIDPQGREQLARVWKPCPMVFEARSADGEIVSQGRRLLKQSFDTRRMQGFHLQVYESGNYTATFRLADNAQEIAIIEGIEVVNQLHELPFEAIKETQNLEQGEVERLDELTEDRKQRDDLIWATLPPLNIHLQVHGQVGPFRQPPEGVEVPQWVLEEHEGQHAARRIRNLFIPRNFINTETGEMVLSHKDFLAGKPIVDGEWEDDGTGIFFSRADYPQLDHDIYLSPLADILGSNVQMYLGLLGAWDYRGYSIAQRYFENGDPETGHDAALALVRIAHDWPALEMSLHEHRLNTHAPDFEYNTDWSNPRRRNGKYFYSGWAGGVAMDLMRAYDKLFPYIQENQVFADAVNRFVPFIETPEDVVAFLDQRLVYGSVRDYRRDIIRGQGIEDLAGEVLGPHQRTAQFFDLTRQHATIYPFSGTFKELYGTALGRLGHYHIGSTGYARGSAASLIRKARSIKHAREAGLDLPMDISDVDRYAKVRAAGDFLIDHFVAGGFTMMSGTASGGTHSGPNYWQNRIGRSMSAAAVELWGDPRHAWLLVNVHGVDEENIVEIAEGFEHPVLHNESRYLAGWGGIMEFGVEETDVRNKTAAFLNVSRGQGHAHHDHLDLNLYAMGLPVSVDLAQRDEGNNWTRPGAGWSFLHNRAIAHDTDDPRQAGNQAGEPWLRAFDPPLMRGSYVDNRGEIRLDRDVILMQVGDSHTYYAFDVQRLSGSETHTWCFHGIESKDLDINIPMREEVVRWTDRMLPGRGDKDLPLSQRIGENVHKLQAVWTATREEHEYEHQFRGGGTVRTVALEPSVLGDLYNPDLPEAHVRATLLGHEAATVMVAKPFSQPYRYAFPFLWVQHDAPEDGSTIYPAIYEWYRGDTPIVEEAELVSRDPLLVRVTTTAGQIDSYYQNGDEFMAVSRDQNGVRFAQLSGGKSLQADGITINAQTSRYSTPIVTVDYVKRQFTTGDDLPALDSAMIGNDGRKSYYLLEGQGREFYSPHSLLAHTGQVEDFEIIDDETIRLKTSQRLFHAGIGNRKSEGFVVTNEDHSWHFRSTGQRDQYRVINRPPDQILTENVFSDRTGDGLVHAYTYEIGLGDTVDIPANIIVRRSDDGYELKTNTPVSGNIKGTNVKFAPSLEWQRVD